jgi:hypothetical protein
MDYYEELGLSKAASVEEIRQAYRQVARLIHPDQQTDDDLRRLAEVQMKRLNLILEVLTDPVRRREYDLSLAPPFPPVRIRQQRAPNGRPGILEWRRQVRGSVWVWVGAALVGAISIVTFFSDYAATGPALVQKTSANQGWQPGSAAGTPRVIARQQEQSIKPMAPMKTGPSENPLPPPQHSAPVKFKPTVRQEALSQERETDPPPTLPQPDTTLAIEEEPPRIPIPDLKAPLVQPPGESGFAGNWLYLPSTEPGGHKGLYAPEYIEMKIAEDKGRLQGLYRARYLVTNRAISPSVVFHFEGRATAPLSTLRWNGSGGSDGRVTLKLISPNSLEVTWIANHLANELGLISGVATLVRQQEP